MGLLNLPDDFDTVPVRTQINKLLREAQNDSKPEECILCGKKQTSFCNSHSIPQMILKNIADNGKILQANVLFDLEILDLDKGVKNSGTFHIICNDCDSKYFQDYEDPIALENKPTDKMFAEIALKNTLIQLAKREQELKMFQNAQKQQRKYLNFEDLEHLMNLDIIEFKRDVEFYKDIIDCNREGCFQILYWNVLPYKIPIAAQSMLALMEDMEGIPVNDIFDMSDRTRMQYMHICAFPLESESAILAFYHKRDKLYRTLRHELNSSPEGTKLKYINWLIFKYTENYFFSPQVKHELENNEVLKKLCHDNSGAPNMGLIDDLDVLKEYRAPSMEDIPNILDAEHAV